MSQPYDRVFNFSAGPCTLPIDVLEEVNRDLFNWKGTGMSVMEMSHRGKAFEGILAEAVQDLKTVMEVPDNYTILFLQGGASMQNTMIPMNLLRPGETADYVVTGAWGQKSYEAAPLCGNVRLAYDGKSHNYSEAPDLMSLGIPADTSYVHYTSNETIQGVDFVHDVDLFGKSVCDMSSNILSRPIDVNKYALIYAGAQKNMGPAGATVVIIRDDFLDRTPANMHPMLDYKLAAKNGSMYNTPPCWSIYVCGLMYKWLIRNGGTKWIYEINKRKAQVIYDAIDNSGGFYKGHAKKENRSLMNLTFTLPSEEMTDVFIKEAQGHKLDGLKGHRSVGGCRASIYNAFPEEGCRVMAEFMADFARRNG